MWNRKMVSYRKDNSCIRLNSCPMLNNFSSCRLSNNDSFQSKNVHPQTFATISSSSSGSQKYRKFSFNSNDVNQVIQRLEQGSILVKFYPKIKPEKRIFVIKYETMQLFCFKTTVGKDSVESVINFFDVKEVRLGKCSKAFEKWHEDAKKWNKDQCFVLLYGNAFTLKQLSCVAMSVNECDQWIKGITYISQEYFKLPYCKLLDQWMKKKFDAIGNEKALIPLKSVKVLLTKMNYKISTSKLKESLNIINDKNNGQISYFEFYKLTYKFLHEKKLFDGFFRFITKDKKIIRAKEFTFFMNRYQNENITQELAEKIIINNISNKKYKNFEFFFDLNEFIDYLFSNENSIFDKKFDSVNQNMEHPLTHYWIASSHNTYLIGDQIKSESSTEAYVRCLRMGCKCIELDCWDGPDGMPNIYHGNTLTTKIKFIDAIKTIRENAFVKSEFPVILSIENHCSLAQQRQMAICFKEIFGDLLLTQKVDKNETQMPSPNQLKKKIIIKHKKLSNKNEDLFFENISNNILKSGKMFIEQENTKELKPYFFILTNSKLWFTDYKSNDETEEELDEETNNYSKDLIEEELHFGEPWFHGRLPGKRNQAEELLKKYSYLGDGTFLVRESNTFVGDFSLSFWRAGKPNHCRIKTCEKNGKTKYYLIDKVTFDSLYMLISHYQSNFLTSSDFSVKLGNPVPQANSHENKVWFHKDLQRTECEEIFKHFKQDGSFLVRQSAKEENCYSITFTTEDKVKHCRVKQRGHFYTIGSSNFTSLVDLVNYYQKHYLYGSTKLKCPISSECLKKLEQGKDNISDSTGNNKEDHYLDPNNISKTLNRTSTECKTKKGDELSFINNLTNHGTIKEKDNTFFQDDIEELPLKSLEKGYINLIGCRITLPQNSNKKLSFKIFSQAQQKSLDLIVPTEEDFYDWLFKIKEAAGASVNGIKKCSKIEQKEKIAKEFSDLIVYCRSVPFVSDKFGHYTKMCSLNETKAEKIINSQNSLFLHKFNLNQLTRVYPLGIRVGSSNFDPIKFWNYGVQIVALNYQTPDRAMQLNQAKFLQNGSCGYLLKPDFMLDVNFDINKHERVKGIEPQIVSLKIIAGRNLSKNNKRLISPYVEIEIIGVDYDCLKVRTNTIQDNGFNPVWDENFVFNVDCPDLSFLRFSIYGVEMFPEPNFIAQATYPLKCLKNGYRSVHLKNEFNENLELASLLVHLHIKNAKENEEIYSSIKKLTQKSRNLYKLIEQANNKNDFKMLSRYEIALKKNEQQLNAKKITKID